MLNMLWTAEYNAEWDSVFQSRFNLKRAGFNIHNQLYHWMTEDELIEALQGEDIFFVGYDPITSYVLDRCPDLKLILSVRDGPEENIDLKACTERGIPVLNSAGRCTVSVSELTFNLIMNMARPVLSINSRFRNEKWTKQNYQSMRDVVEANSTELYRKTLGIIGVGRNGCQLARYAKAFGMNVIAYDPYASEEKMEGLGIKLCPLNTVMAESDYISILARVTPENHNLVGREQIHCMKPTACLVNTGRPQLLDLEALLDALKTDKIRMAALDVHKPEPIPEDSPVYNIPPEKLILTNHMAGFSAERAWHQYHIGLANLNQFLSGQGLPNNCTKGVEGTAAFAERGGKLFGIEKSSL